jgi:hypothetical protein
MLYILLIAECDRDGGRRPSAQLYVAFPPAIHLIAMFLKSVCMSSMPCLCRKLWDSKQSIFFRSRQAKTEPQHNQYGFHVKPSLREEVGTAFMTLMSLHLHLPMLEQAGAEG